MHYLANVPGIEHFLAKKCSCPEWGDPGICTIWLMSQGLSTFWLKSAHAWRGGGNIPDYHVDCQYKHHALFLACYQSAHLLSKGSTEGLHLPT